jgi:hypothetical protein
MDKGAAVEYDTPENLFRQGGIFYSMCEKSNISIEDIEVSLASRKNHTNADSRFGRAASFEFAIIKGRSYRRRK